MVKKHSNFNSYDIAMNQDAFKLAFQSQMTGKQPHKQRPAAVVKRKPELENLHTIQPKPNRGGPGGRWPGLHRAPPGYRGPTGGYRGLEPRDGFFDLEDKWRSKDEHYCWTDGCNRICRRPNGMIISTALACFNPEDGPWAGMSPFKTPYSKDSRRLTRPAQSKQALKLLGQDRMRL